MTVRAVPLVVVLLVAGIVSGCATAVGNAVPEGPQVLFADEFSGAARDLGGAWRTQTGAGGWGNDEVQTYTDDPGNVRIDGNGNLAITARRTAAGFTSARVSTQYRYSVTYGRVAARISLPAGQGLHPAFWLLGDNIDRVGWPASGEIDIIETLNDADQYHTGVHVPRESVPRGQNISAGGTPAAPLPGTFHEYWMNKFPDRIETGIDGDTLLVVRPDDLEPDSRWVFDQPFHLLFTLAVGGNWPGPPDASTPRTSTMLVDWVRVVGL